MTDCWSPEQPGENKKKRVGGGGLVVDLHVLSEAAGADDAVSGAPDQQQASRKFSLKKKRRRHTHTHGSTNGPFLSQRTSVPLPTSKAAGLDSRPQAGQRGCDATIHVFLSYPKSGGGQTDKKTTTTTELAKSAQAASLSVDFLPCGKILSDTQKYCFRSF